MVYALLADATLVLHLCFILFVVFGGLLALRNRRWALFHLPAALWGAVVEFTGWVCPLTLLENRFRAKSGWTTYPGDFIRHYLASLIYPRALTHRMQVVLGIGVVVLNLLIYVWVFRRKGGGRRENDGG